MKSLSVLFAVVGLLLATSPKKVGADVKLMPTVRLQNSFTVDPDDMCFLQLGPAKGLTIVSDKSAQKVLLFDDAGHQLDAVELPKPGNIDVRSGFSLGGNRVPLIVVNQRETDPQLRALTIAGLDSAPKLKLLPSRMPTGPNYGGCLYHSPKDGAFYFFSTVKDGLIQQFKIETVDDQVVSTRVRHWESPICEGAVADDELGVVFLGEEQVGIRKIGAEPDEPTDGQFILKIGQHGVTGDIEGLTLLKTGKTSGFLIASDQQSNRFIVLDRKAPHQFLGSFQVDGASDTDGIDLATFSLGPKFPNGAFACHTDADAPGKAVLLVPLPKLKARLAAMSK